MCCSANKKAKASKKIAILKQLPTHFQAKREKCLETPFPRVSVAAATEERTGCGFADLTTLLMGLQGQQTQYLGKLCSQLFRTDQWLPNEAWQ